MFLMLMLVTPAGGVKLIQTVGSALLFPPLQGKLKVSGQALVVVVDCGEYWQLAGMVSVVAVGQTSFATPLSAKVIFMLN